MTETDHYGDGNARIAVAKCPNCGYVYGDDLDYRFPNPSECLKCGGETENTTVADSETVRSLADDGLRADGGQPVNGIDLSGDTENIGGKEPSGKPAAIGRWTFQTKKVRDALLVYLHGRVLNPFAGKTRLDDYCRGITEIRNDLNPERDADYHRDAADLGDVLEPDSFDVAVLDPPFSQSQSEEHYDGLHARDMGEVRREVAKLVKPGGTIVEFGFNLYDASDYLTHWHREDKRLFRRAIPERPPVFMTVCERSQRTFTDGGEWPVQPGTDRADGGGRDE